MFLMRCQKKVRPLEAGCGGPVSRPRSLRVCCPTKPDGGDLVTSEVGDGRLLHSHSHADGRAFSTPPHLPPDYRKQPRHAPALDSARWFHPYGGLIADDALLVIDATINRAGNEAVSRPGTVARGAGCPTGFDVSFPSIVGRWGCDYASVACCAPGPPSSSRRFRWPHRHPPRGFRIARGAQDLTGMQAGIVAPPRLPSPPGPSPRAPPRSRTGCSGPGARALPSDIRTAPPPGARTPGPISRTPSVHLRAARPRRGRRSGIRPSARPLERSTPLVLGRREQAPGPPCPATPIRANSDPTEPFAPCPHT